MNFIVVIATFEILLIIKIIIFEPSLMKTFRISRNVDNLYIQLHKISEKSEFLMDWSAGVPNNFREIREISDFHGLGLYGYPVVLSSARGHAPPARRGS